MKEDWVEAEFESLLNYIQPTNYIVKSTNYNDSYQTPVLTPGKSFIKGYTDEKDGIFEDLPAIIFDDFTTASRYVNFPFKVKSSAMKILKPTSELVNLKYVFSAMQITDVRSDTHKRYWISVFAKEKISLPPLPEQRAIVAKIEQLFSELDNGIANLKTAQEKLEIYRQAVLKKAFEGELTKTWREQQSDLPSADELLEQIKHERQRHYEQQLADWEKAVKAWEIGGKEGRKPVRPKGNKVIHNGSNNFKYNNNLPSLWKMVSFSELGYWTGGGTPAKSNREFWTNGNILWISPKDMKTKLIKNTIDKINDIAVNKSSAKYIEKNSLLFVVRSGILRRILPVSITTQRSTVNQDIQALTPYLVNSQYLYWFAISNELDIRNNCAKDGTTVESIETSLLKAYPVTLCSLQEQTQIVQEIESRLSVCDKLSDTLKDQLKKAEALRQSILKKAFEGRLLSDAEIEACKQEADWEPAEQLLARIKAEKVAK